MEAGLPFVDAGWSSVRPIRRELVLDGSGRAGSVTGGKEVEERSARYGQDQRPWHVPPVRVLAHDGLARGEDLQAIGHGLVG
jgi:hypothetical protein